MEGSDLSTRLSVPLSRQGLNFAPAKPVHDLLRNKKPNKQPSKFEKAFRDWYTAKLNYQKASRDECISAAQLVSLFRRGQQLGVYRRPYGAPGYYVRPLVGDDTTKQTAMNIMTFHSQVCESKVMASNPTVNMRAGDDTPEAIASAQACRPVVDCYETEWYTAKFSRREAIRFLTDGMVIYQVRWNPFKGKHEVRERSVTRKEVQTYAGEGSCADCDFQGEADAFSQSDHSFTCPQCGSQATDVTPAQRSSIAQIGMGAAKPAGEPELIVSSFMGWHWDMRVDLELSPWAIKRQRISQGAINLMLGDVNIPDSASSEDYGLEVLDALARSGQSLQGASYTAQYGTNSDVDKQPTMFEAWLSPEEQALIEVEEGETLTPGVRMPAGKLSNFCKGEPCCVVGLNDSAAIVGVFLKESHQRETITAHWYMDADSGYGRGMEDTAGVQRRFNQVDGQIYQGLAQGATPSVFIDRSILKEDDGKYLYRPGQNIYVNLSMLPPNTTLKDAIWSPPAIGVHQQYIQYGATLMGQMAQMSSLAVEFGETLLSIDNRTATGAQITNGLANSLYGPMLMSKGEVRVSIAQMIVALVSKHAVAGRYYPGQGAAKGRLVAGEDLRGKVIFELVQNSHLPVTSFSEQTDARSFMETFGSMREAAMLQKEFPEFFRATSKPFNMKFGSETEDDVSNLCLKRLEQMKAALQMGVTDPNELVEMIHPPVSPREPKHVEKRDWFSRWLDLESAQEAPMPLRLAAEVMWNVHLNYETQTQMPVATNAALVEGVAAAAAQAPSALGAAALQGQQPPPEQEDKSLEIESKMQIEQMKGEKDLALKQMENENQREVAGIQSATMLKQTELQGKNTLENTRLAGQNAVRVAKAKPRPKPAAKKTA